MHLPLSIALRPSRQLCGLLWLVHLAAFSCLLPLAFPLWGKALLALGTALSLYRTLRHVRRTAVSRLVLRRDGRVEVFRKVDAGGTLCELPVATRLGSLIVLELRDGAECWRIALLPDAASSDDMRHLRVWLNWRKPPSA